MNSLEIISHCWAGQLEQYARHLQIQLSSILEFADRLPVIISVCYSPTDFKTTQVIRAFRPILLTQLNAVAMSEGELFRRAIGRNRCAKRSNADLVWYTDVDYFFGHRSLKSLCEVPRTKWGRLMLPGHVWRQNDWVTGDQIVNALVEVGDYYGPVPLPKEKDFTLTLEKRAIGGIMIVPGDDARRDGFLDGTKWMNPVDPSKGFRRCKCDPAWRRALDMPRGTRLYIPQVFRIRHTLNGREAEYASDVHE